MFFSWGGENSQGKFCVLKIILNLHVSKFTSSHRDKNPFFIWDRDYIYKIICKITGTLKLIFDEMSGHRPLCDDAIN